MPSCTPDFNINGEGPLRTINLELLDAKILGAAVVRVEFPWPLIEVGRGTFDWSRADAIMDAARAQDVPILPIVTWTPRWAGGGQGLNAPPRDDDDWTTFVSALMERYGSQFPRGVDLWNEPDDGSYFAGDPQAYVSEILNPAYSVIKALSPHTQVVMAGSANDAGSCCPWVAAVVKAGGRFDVAAFHDYAGNSAAVGKSLATILAADGRGGTPIWLTEYSVDSTTSDQSQAIASVVTSGAPIQAAIWYNLRDTNSYSCCPPSVLKRAHWGLLESDFSPKDGFYVLQRRLGGRGVPEGPAATS